MSVAYRPLAGDVDAERHFVVDGWVRSYQYSDTAGMIAPEDWFGVMIPQVERVMSRPDARAIVAYEPAAKRGLADLYGFIIVDTAVTPPVVFYCYVKECYRRCGFARGLFAAAGVDPRRPFVYACTTEVVSRIRGDRTRPISEQRIPLGRWDPAIARFRKDDPRRPRRHR